ncbi:hypothetical protein ACMA1D_12955 [Streptomyces sp. 796.1]|uniref:hypothetical protein n=1 Tax=Streptomyces sp. 796.1 TaxID=3163029 RepID=UPI0039C944CE
MPLHVSPAPAPALRSVLTALGSPAAVHEARTPALRVEPGSLAVAHPLPLHVLDHVTPRAGQAAAPITRLIGWRFLIVGAEHAVAAAEALLTPGGWAFSHFCEGPYVTSTEQALRRADALPTAYQPRLLSVPELYMLTLWLHRETADEPAGGPPAPADLLVPLAPAPPGIAANRPHQVADLLPMLTLRLTPEPLLGTPA